MGDLVSHMTPKPKALVNRRVGGVKVRIPVDLGRGDLHYVDIGITTVSAPIDVFTDNPMGAFRMREAVKRLLAGSVRVKYGRDARGEEDAHLSDILTDMIVEKVRDTL